MSVDVKHTNNQVELQLIELLRSKLGSKVVDLVIALNEVSLTIAPVDIKSVFGVLKSDKDLNFNFLASITAVDWLDSRDNRFEVVYHLMNLDKLYRLRVKVQVGEDDPTVDSVLHLWAAADFLESETWDMYGINFRGNPDIRRMLMYPEFEGHPLRKDYPVQGKQPRIPLRSPEVRNTATDMVRPTLVQIGKNRSLSGAGA